MDRLDIAQEQHLPTEAKAIQTLVEVLIAQIEKTYPTGIMRRDAHPKQHGLLQGEFIIEPNLPANLRVGVFSEAKSYPCWIRFSNSGGTGGIHPDKNPDVRGMGIKLVGVDGEKILEANKDAVTHDFLVASFPVFIVKNAMDFAVVASGLGKPDYLKLLNFFLNPFNLHLRELILLIRSQIKCANLLGQQFWSMTPYLLGEGQAVKYTAIPRNNVDNTMPENPTDNFLRDRLRQHLATEDATYDFCVQLQKNPYTQPIEDTRIEWKESDSPFIKIATVKIPSQTFESKEQEDYGEDLSFSPWHALPEHRPLGSINRSRRVVYQAISKYRHQINGEKRMEPTDMKIFFGDDHDDDMDD